MGFVRLSITVCLLITLYTYIASLLEPKLPVNVDGYYHPALKRVADVFRKNVESGKEPGGAFAVYHKGKLVFDMWGGYADVEAQRPWSRDTITLAYSTSKGVAAVTVATMVERGYLDYKRPVADYWPEFAQNNKGNITVEMLLSHQAGLAVLDEAIHLRDIKDNPKKVEDILTRQRTQWPADFLGLADKPEFNPNKGNNFRFNTTGTRHGYHAITFGAYVDTLVRKADPKGRDIAKIFKEDIADIHDLDMFMNTPKDQFYRAARLHQAPALLFLLKAYTCPKYARLFTNLILFPGSVFAKSVKAVAEFSSTIYNHNNPDIREIPLSSAFGAGTARAFAKLFGILGNGGKTDAHRLLSEESVSRLATPLWTGPDYITGLETGFGLGTQFAKNPKGQTIFGHQGHGGQMGMADLDNKLGFAYLTNHIDIYAQGDDPRFLDLEQELYKCLEEVSGDI